MSYPKIARLVWLLAQNTESGNVEWSRTEHSHAFQSSFADYAVRIINTDPVRQDYAIQIFDAFGDTVEEVSDDELREFLPDATSRMKEIYDVARRKVMGVEDALDAILRELDDPHPF